MAPRLAAQKEIKTTLNGPVGLQLWSLREYCPKDLRGTLGKVRAMGFQEVEAAGLWGATLADMRAALDAAGLRCRSAHLGFDRLRDDPSGAIAEAKGLGAVWAVCAWIPHQKTVGREDILKAADVFNTFATAASKEGLRFAYHCHGYEFVPSPEGTLFETFAGAADPARVAFQVDVFHSYHGGMDPTKLIERYKGRVVSLHLKDMKKGSARQSGHGRRQARRGRTGRLGPDRHGYRSADGCEVGRLAVLHRGRERRSLGTHPAEREVSRSVQIATSSWTAAPGPSSSCR